MNETSGEFPSQITKPSESIFSKFIKRLKSATPSPQKSETPKTTGEPYQEKSLEQMLKELKDSTDRQKEEQGLVSEESKKGLQAQADQTKDFRDAVNSYFDKTLK
jgi:alpha-glucuronidase